MSTAIVLLGFDLAKNVFALHGVDRAGQPVRVRPLIWRDLLVKRAVLVLTPSPDRPRRRLHPAPTRQARANAWRMSGLAPCPGAGGRTLAAPEIAPSPGQGEGWDGGRMHAQRWPNFDPLPSPPPARGRV